MANVKITQLPSATTPLTGTEVFPLVQGTTTKQVAITGLFTSPVMTNPTLGTVGQADLINATGLPISTGVAGLGTGVATFLGTPSSSNLRAAVTDETGTGSLVFATSPTLVTPNLGTPSVLVATNATGTAVGLTAGSAITNANLTGAVTSVGNATSLGSFTSAQLRTALTDETGAGSAVFATSPTITAPILNQINDTNNAQILGLSPTTSAVDYLVVKNGIGVAVPLHFYADGSSANIGLHIQPKGSGLVTISDGTDFNKGIRFRSSGSAASAITLLDAVATAGRVVTLPDATTTLVGRDTTDTLTNKTIAFSSNTFSGTLAIANGGTNASTAASAIENLLPAYAGNGSKGLRLNSGATALEWVADGGGTVTSVAATVPSFLSIAGSPITTSGTLAISLSGTALPTTSGGTGLTSFTSGGVVYASSTSALATGSALTFDGTNLYVGGTTGAFGGTQKGFAAESGTVIAVLNGESANSVGSVGTVSNHDFSFKTNGSERARITSGGDFCVGSTSVPSAVANYRSLVVGGVTGGIVDMGTTSTSYGRVSADSVGLNLESLGATTTIFRTNGSERARIDSSGNFGIGTSSISASYGRLTVAGTGITITEDTNAKLQIGRYSSGAPYSYIKMSANSSGLKFTNPSDTVDLATLDSAGNLGLGTAPSAWSGSFKALQVGDRSAIVSVSNSTILSSNYFNDGTADKYMLSAAASLYQQIGGDHRWLIAPSGTAGNAISFTQAMTLDASGNFGVGTTSPAFKLDVFGTTPAIRLKANGVGTGVKLEQSSATGDVELNVIDGYPLLFKTNNTERARIPSTGGFQSVTSISVGNATPTTSGAGITFPATQSASSDANTLDDYEEGAIDGNNLGLTYATVGTSSFGYSDRRGTYTKIGRVVYFTIDIRLSSFSKGTASGDIFVVGLPFAQRDTGGFDGARCTVQLYNWTYTTSPVIAVVGSSGTNIGISRMVSNDVSTVINDPNGNSIIWITGFYFV